MGQSRKTENMKNLRLAAKHILAAFQCLLGLEETSTSPLSEAVQKLKEDLAHKDDLDDLRDVVDAMAREQTMAWHGALKADKQIDTLQLQIDQLAKKLLAIETERHEEKQRKEDEIWAESLNSR